jgi:hypothetical protein
MKKIALCGLSLMALSFSYCNQSPILDRSKLNTAYFVGVYQTDYRNEIETITLKENGWYDYAHGKDYDTIIKDAGKWEFDKEGQFVYIDDFPNIRKNEVYENKGKIFNMQMRIDGSFSGLGDIYTLDPEEGWYTFVKLDKSKNKDYILKK